MKRIITVLALCSLLALGGCDDKDARDYAKELVGVLKSYQSEVNKKIKAERESYKDLAGTYAYARQVNLSTTLRDERFRRIDTLTDALLQDDAKITPSEIHNLLIDYAGHDFDATRSMLEQESDGQAEYLASLESLELQAQSIEALSKALEELAKPKSDIKKLRELGKSAQEFRDKFLDLECEELARQIACLKKEKDALTNNAGKESNPSRKEKLMDDAGDVEEEIKRLTEQFNNGNCKADLLTKTTCPDK